MRPSTAEQTLMAVTAEGTTLPFIRAAGFEARVNAYVVGRTARIQRMAGAQVDTSQPASAPAYTDSAQSRRSPGCSGGATDLWYLSLVAPRGHGTTLRAIWANLVGNTHHAVWLEGVGMVALGHQRLDLSGSSVSGGLGYPLHWTYRQAVIPPSRDVQGVLESDLLTCYDPLLAPVVTRASRQGHVGRRKPSAASASEDMREAKHTDRSSMTLSSSTSASATQLEDETQAHEAHPLFLLLTRASHAEPAVACRQGNDQDGNQGSTTLARLYLRYLATRIPWLSYYPAWAGYLWRRALARGEAEPLQVWSYGAAPAPSMDHSRISTDGAQTEYVTSYFSPYLAAAYLCRPDPLALTADLSQAIAAGMFQTEPLEAVFSATAEAERAA
jgi:hypothetical protein